MLITQSMLVICSACGKENPKNQSEYFLIEKYPKNVFWNWANFPGVAEQGDPVQISY